MVSLLLPFHFNYVLFRVTDCCFFIYMVFSIYRHSFSIIPVLQGEEHKLSLPRPDQAANAREEIAGEPSSSEPHAVST